MNKARFEAFSDGVFAFAITLLALGLVLPEFKSPPTEVQLTEALLRLWPNLLAFVLSFSVIGIMWQNHHALFRSVERVDRSTVLLNFFLLAVTVFIPFATSVLGAYPRLRPSAFLYGLTLTSSAAAFNLLVWHLTRSHAFDSNIPRASIRQTVTAYRIGLATYFVAMLTSLLAPLLSFGLYLLVAACFFLPRGVDTDLGSDPKRRR
jgi:uncharacterized membrane protein